MQEIERNYGKCITLPIIYKSERHSDKEVVDFLRKKYIDIEVNDKEGAKMIIGMLMLDEGIYEQLSFLKERIKSSLFEMYVKKEKERTRQYIC